jgi:hypothetical protein
MTAQVFSCHEVNTIWCLLLIDGFALPPRSIYAQWAIAAGLFITGVVLFTIAFGETMRVLTGTYRRPSTDKQLEFLLSELVVSRMYLVEYWYMSATAARPQTCG